MKRCLKCDPAIVDCFACGYVNLEVEELLIKAYERMLKLIGEGKNEKRNNQMRILSGSYETN